MGRGRERGGWGVVGVCWVCLGGRGGVVLGELGCMLGCTRSCVLGGAVAGLGGCWCVYIGLTSVRSVQASQGLA